MYCIIEAMIGVDSGVQRLDPVADGVPDMARHFPFLALKLLVDALRSTCRMAFELSVPSARSV